MVKSTFLPMQGFDRANGKAQLWFQEDLPPGGLTDVVSPAKAQVLNTLLGQIVAEKNHAVVGVNLGGQTRPCASGVSYNSCA